MLVTNYVFVLLNQCVYIYVHLLHAHVLFNLTLNYTQVGLVTVSLPIGVHSYHLNKKIIIVHLMCFTPSNFFFFSLATTLSMPLMHHNFISVQAWTKLNPKLNLSRLVTL